MNHLSNRIITLKADVPNYKATVSLKREGINTWFKADFSVADAITAGIFMTNDVWKKYAKQMVIARAKSMVFKTAFPEKIKGVQDSDVMIDVEKGQEKKVVKNNEKYSFDDETVDDLVIEGEKFKKTESDNDAESIKNALIKRSVDSNR